MVIDKHTVLNLPSLDDRKMDNLIALQAACQVTGAPGEANLVKPYIDEFTRFLNGSTDATDRLVRRYVLLVVTEGRAPLGGTSGNAASDLTRLVQDLYRKVL